MRYAKISGTGSYLPEQVLTNSDLEQRIDTSDAWITERTGIRQRHIAAEYETGAYMAYQAAERALQASGIDKHEIDLIVVATSTPDKVMPSNACYVQKHLQIQGCAAFDLAAACSGFIYGLVTASQFIQAGTAKHALVIGVEIMSRVVDWQDRSTCILFGDGAGAVVLTASDEPGIHRVAWHANGDLESLLYANGFNTAATQQDPYLKMCGSEVFRHAVKTLGGLAGDLLAQEKLAKTELDWLVPHQANIRIIHAAAKALDLPLERVIITVDKHANTSAASLPLALDDGVRTGKIKRGHRLLMEAFGSGFTWGGALITY